LHDVGYFCGDEVEERVYAQARRGLDLDGEFANCADGFADKVNVYFGSVSKKKVLVARKMYEADRTYSRNSVRTSLMFFSVASMKRSSSFVTFT
jgi:hypothetical protein